MSEEIFRRSETTSKRLAKAEANTETRLNRAMATRFSRLERNVRRNWDEYQGLNQLPNQKAIALSKVLDEYLNPTDFKSEGIFRDLFERSQSEGTSLAKDLFKLFGEDNIKEPSNTNDFVDFWSTDSSNRLGDWGNAFKRDARAIFELGMSQNWSANQVIDALTSRFGRLQQEAERIVRTGSISTVNSVTSTYYNTNGIELVQWLTAGDDRVCLYCSPRNGNIYYLNDITFPLHPRDRCFLLPVRRKWLNRGQIDREFWKQQKADGLQQLRDAGGKTDISRLSGNPTRRVLPNYGASPFEKKAGRIDAPKPAWQPDKGFTYGEKSKTRRLTDES